MTLRVAVVGSGLSGVACARALIRRGLRPVMIDAGMGPGEAIEGAVARMRASPPHEWDSADAELIRRNPTLHGGGIPTKLAFGSDYIYAADHPEAGIVGEGIEASTTLAKGGFSNAWGGAVLPAADCDLGEDWPLRSAALEPHYRAVHSWLPLSGADDSLSRQFPSHTKFAGALELPPQARGLQRDLSTTAASDGFVFGQARLAVETAGASACRYCGLCLSGCVYGSIYSAAADVDRMVKEATLEYRPGLIVLGISEAPGGVRLLLRDTKTGRAEELAFDRVFLAAGAINSTRLILGALSAFDEPVEFKDSQKFLFPIFRLAGQPIRRDHMNSLASLFIEMRLDALGGNWMHIQISPVSDFVMRRLRVDRSSVIGTALSPLLKRTVMAWASLHSRHSASLMGTLRRRGEHADFEFANANLEKGRRSVAIAARAFARIAPRFRSLVVPQLAKLSAPGASNHLGGSLPMRARPSARLHSDLLGRAAGMQRTHVVDAAVMPSIPGTTMALVMMANADRIATLAPLG
jgi:choline dehydrogenase-like flavoprotein